MKIIGIDLAALPRNATGFCKLKNKHTRVKTLNSNEEINKGIDEFQPDLIAIDGPLFKPEEGQSRECDEEIKKYVSLPPLTSSGMQKLMKRAVNLSRNLKKNYELIEIKPPATAQALGVDREEGEEQRTQKQLLKMGLKGTIERRILNIDELDSILAALTGKLYLDGKTEEKGGKDGKIIIPKTGD